MHLSYALALLTSLSVASARPQSSSSSSSGSTSGGSANSTKPAYSGLPVNITAPTEAERIAFIQSYANLYNAGAAYAQKQRPNWKPSDFAVYSISADTAANSSRSYRQTPFTEMEIQWLNSDWSVATVVDNFSGDIDGEWSIDTYNLTKNETATAHTYWVGNISVGFENVLKSLANRSLYGPWNDLSVNFPDKDPLTKQPMVNSTQFVWYEFTSYLNISQSFLATAGGRILRKS